MVLLKNLKFLFSLDHLFLFVTNADKKKKTKKFLNQTKMSNFYKKIIVAPEKRFERRKVVQT